VYIVNFLRLKGEFTVVPTDKIVGGAYHQKFTMIWTAYLWNCMSHDQRDLKVTHHRKLNFRSDFCSFYIDEEY